MVVAQKKRPNACYTWNGHLRGELGRHKAFSLLIVFRETSDVHPLLLQTSLAVLRVPQKCSVSLMTPASPDTGLSQGGSGSFACVCVKEGVIILLA